ncbi:MULTISPECIES: hypothetical protein [unclassified Ensifer]|uniref:hypothetical protein n=1 Tax=unclassified Ensifer TaxID=2633371 RepID=UPI00070B6227|nr:MULTISPECIES: hypothetical protein [unclassified Ensifer]KQW62886.1 hypothetical protein ASD02_01850 [Ensifer sp. Root1252]KRC83707.1 hypothetical protein ASE32_01840 [Ensifer sp. Root231]KRD04060.1 hypothetical protein ASE47_00500 [Ensifer sp. Root258]
MTKRDKQRRIGAFRKGFFLAREMAITAASQTLDKGIECECSSTDPATGTLECSLMVRNLDCLCSERRDEAADIVARIRQITIGEQP